MSDNRVEFYKLEGCGNNFICIYDRGYGIAWQKVARQLLDPNFALGTDGLMVVHPRKGEHFPVEMYNPDGSSCGMCGNGIRCLSRLLYLEKAITDDTSKLHFKVVDRQIVCETLDQGLTVRVDMGSPSFSPDSIPLASKEPFIDAELQLQGQSYTATVLSMGNPHCVIFCNDIDSIPLHQIGPAFEHHALFPQRANIEFCQILAADRVKVRVWERGAGLTLACGTGACAVTVAGVLNKKLQPQTTVELPGGTVKVEFDQSANKVFLIGPAREIFRGTLLAAPDSSRP